MIASLNGLVLTRTPAAVILDVHGVGYEVFISSRTYDTLPAIGAPCVLHVQTVVREDAITLYGFARPEEKELFLLLVTVSGIGPKLALTILSGIGAADLRQADLSRCAVAIGSEGSGVSQALLAASGKRLIIPMRDRCESLNAAAAAAVVLWEMAR